ncbi:MAG: zf-HC2 domain-containing protein [Endomicrobiales bacterium]|nr:zf-HC2 domain-containing protein [Endomicrobiales bacterium]
MVCREIDYIFQYIDGELGPGEKAGFEEHLKGCPRCRRAVDFMESLSKMPVMEPPGELTAKTVEKFKEHKYRESGFFAPFVAFFAHPILVPVFLVIAVVGILVLNRPVDTNLVSVKISVPMPGSHARVSLVGDFNGWDVSRGRLKKKGENWTGTFRVKPGRYQYMLVVDGEKWMPDPTAKEFVEDGYGNRNSVLDVTKI